MMDARGLENMLLTGLVAAFVVGCIIAGASIWLWQHVGLVWPFYWKG